ncbi:ATP-dependent DNA helicase PIF1 [Holothuria leucospilota]|uniref:ATP-dependent DNA helicase n=1 Tax=Holothuria leucospilota TaxID=206669 RepID=A0A9Q1BBA2_HOLLE|nr:ATP-dependent DNA helicase PIF1 [Holothuria leucospilota]
MTASTGLAAAALQGTTVHAFFGIKDGRYGNEDIAAKIQNDIDFKAVKDRILRTDTLIIDEISMLSQKIFHQIDFICRKIHGKPQPFGGAQMILVVDLIRAIHEVSRGMHCSVETETLMKSLGRHLPSEMHPLKIFARNYDVARVNSECLLQMTGNMKAYVGTDTGDMEVLSQCTAPKQLYLKDGAPIILTVNISNTIVNGMRGTVQDMQPNYITVKFESVNKPIDIHPYTFSVFSPEKGKDIAWRKQLPVQLGFALTVHKAQGMTIDCLEVDCRHMFIPGQLGVAIGRARSKEGLRVIHFKPECIQPQSAEIDEFYHTISIPLDDNLQCCKRVVQTENETMQSEEGEECTQAKTDMLHTALEYQEIESDAEMAHFMEILEEQEAYETQGKIKEAGFCPADILDSCKLASAITPEQKNLNEEIIILASHSKSVEIFLCEIHSVIKKKFEELVQSSNIENRNFTMFYKAFHDFMKSEQYHHHVQRLFFTSNVSQSQYRLAYELAEKIRSHVVEAATKAIKSKALEKSKATKKTFTESPAGRATQRYIAGWVVHSLRKQKMKAVYDNLYKASSTQTVKVYHTQVEILETFTALSGDTHPQQASMREINRKNNVRKSLCNVTDQVFSLFIKIDKAIRKLETKENIGIYGQNLYKFICDSVNTDMSLKVLWEDLLPLEVDAECAEKLRGEIILKYVKMSCAQFRKEYKRTLGIKKKEAHRKEIKMKPSRKQGQEVAEKSKTNKLPYNTSDTEAPAGPSMPPTTKTQKRKQSGSGKSKGKGKKRKDVNYPCGDCFLECIDMCVCCDSCDLWYHYHCLGIAENDEALKKDQWFCPTCL